MEAHWVKVRNHDVVRTIVSVEGISVVEEIIEDALS